VQGSTQPNFDFPGKFVLSHSNFLSAVDARHGAGFCMYVSV
jgi:hypothetical protein